MVMKETQPWLKVALISRVDSHTTGLARYVYSLYNELLSAGYPVQLIPPKVPRVSEKIYNLLARRGLDARTFFMNYPVRINLDGSEICHISSQNLATLLRVRSMPPSIVTVHDLYPLVQRMQQQKLDGIDQWADRVAVSGLRRAREIIAISQYTKQSVVDLLHFPSERVSVIHGAVDVNIFRPLTLPANFKAKYGLPENASIILYVGSEDPRKNLRTLITAFSQIASQRPEAILVKAGSGHFPDEGAKLRQRVNDLGIASRVVFLGNLPDEDLSWLYNSADIVVMPSLFEGFGFPALEAMACGRPVIAANATSLPEVVGDAGVLFDPMDVDALADAMVQLLANPGYRYQLGERSVVQARTFSLARQAEKTLEVYRKVMHQVKPGIEYSNEVVV